MRSKKLSRREFMAGIATAAGATVLVACAPGAATPSPTENQTGEPLPLEETPRSAAPGRELKVFIVYDSVYGNTAEIAEALIEGLGIQGKSSIFKAQEASVSDLENIDLLLVGSPTHGGTFTEPVKNFLGAIPAQGLQGIKAAAFDTSFSKETQGTFIKIIIDIFGFAAPKIAEMLTAKGASVLALESFIVLETEGPLQDGEIERSKKWAGGLIARVLNA